MDVRLSLPGAEAAWTALLRLGNTLEVRAGTTLLDQEQKVAIVYLIERGSVKLVRGDVRGRRVIVAMRQAPWLLGASALLADRCSPVVAQTITPCRLCSLPSATFSLALENRTIERYIHVLHCNDLVDGTLVYAGLGISSTRDRLMRLLRDATETIGGQTEVEVHLGLNKSELAEALACTPEYLSRLFRQLESQGAIRREGRRLYCRPAAHSRRIPFRIPSAKSNPLIA